MNAALELVRTDRQIGTTRSRSYFNSTCGNENDCSEVQALWRRNGVTGYAVELVYESATKLGYGSKGVRLATAVLNQRFTSNIQVHVAWLIPPGMCILGCCEFGDELIKRRVTIAYTRAIAKHRVEGCRFAVIQQPDLFVTLNGAGTRSQTQQSDRSHRRPDHCLEMLWFHGKTSLIGRLE